MPSTPQPSTPQPFDPQPFDPRPELDTLADLLRERLPDDAVITGPAAVTAAVRLWNSQVTARPAVVARCSTAAEVQAAVRAARSAGVPLSVRGGGHDWAGSAIAEGGLLVDLGGMRQVAIEGDEARVAGGATVSDVLDA
ncbi:FAD-binding protein, partial [Spirillospora sp. NPDC049652]